jgi:hypothetical protein
MVTEFYIFGYETVQYQDGFKAIVNISFKTDEGFKFIKHVLLDHKEVEAFFRSIDAEVYEFAQIPGKEGQCFIEKDCDRYFIRGWIDEKGERK